MVSEPRHRGAHLQLDQRTPGGAEELHGVDGGAAGRTALIPQRRRLRCGIRQGGGGFHPRARRVGGSMGHQCVAVRRKYPDLVGRVVLQDLPETIEKVKVSPLPGFEGTEIMAHDFFTPQPLRGVFPPLSLLSSQLFHSWSHE